MTISAIKDQSLPRKVFLGRLKLIGDGCALAGVGILRMLGGIQVVRHSSGQPDVFLGTHCQRHRVLGVRVRLGIVGCESGRNFHSEISPRLIVLGTCLGSG